MLPDFITIKRRLSERMDSSIAQRMDRDPLLSEIPKVMTHEGDRMTMIRPDGSQETSSYTEHRVQVTIDHSEIEKKGEGAILDAISRMEEQMKESTHREFFKTLDRVTSATGNVVEEKGGGFSAEAYLEGLQKRELDFDEQGRLTGEAIFVHPEKEAVLKSELERLEKDPALLRRRDEIIAGKRREWRDREADRKLVD